MAVYVPFANMHRTLRPCGCVVSSGWHVLCPAAKALEAAVIRALGTREMDAAREAHVIFAAHRKGTR